MMNDRPLTMPHEEPDAMAPITASLLAQGRRLRSLPTAYREEGSATNTTPIVELWKARQKLQEQAWRHFTDTYIKEVLLKVPKWEASDDAPEYGRQVT